MTMMKKLMIAALPIVTLSACQDPATSGSGSSRDEIRIVGSSTVFPFAKAVAESFTNQDPSRPSPILESTGTGGGIELFCSGVGPGTPDIVNASRRMKKGELDRCIENGADEIIELVVGIDGVVIAQSVKGSPLDLSEADVYRALAATPFGKDNSSKTWADVRSGLPAVKINVYGPPSTSGTREALTDLIMEPACAENAEMAALKSSDEDKFDLVCHGLRTDGAYVDTGENDNLIIQKLVANPDSVGIFGYSFLEENLDKIRGIPVQGVEPTYENIAGGKYPGARPLYIYIKKSHIGVIPGLKEYVTEFLKAGAPDGYLVKAGMIATNERTRKEMVTTFENQTPVDAANLE